MSIFNLTDITVPGAYANAMKAARESDGRNAGRHFETGERRAVLKSLQALVRRIAAAVAESRPAASHVTSRPV